MCTEAKEGIIQGIIVALLGIAAFVGAISATNNSNNILFDSTRDYEYEHYCDSIWVNDPDYYKDVLQETDEYQDYIDIHGEWWLYD